MLLFSERLQRRMQLWWSQPNKWRTRDSYRHLFHRLKENYSLLDKDDPDTRWHCCDLWQRLLSNKWNAREFVQRYAVRVPALYWHGRRLSALPINALPDHFVIRPIWGAARRGIYVFAQDRNLLDMTPFTKASLKQHVVRTAGRFVRFPTLVEEFVKTESGRYEVPIDYKFFMFGSTVGAIEVLQRSGRGHALHCFYTVDWVRSTIESTPRSVQPSTWARHAASVRWWPAHSGSVRRTTRSFALTCMRATRAAFSESFHRCLGRAGDSRRSPIGILESCGNARFPIARDHGGGTDQLRILRVGPVVWVVAPPGPLRRTHACL